MKRMRKGILVLEKSIISRRKAYSQEIKEKMNMMLAREKTKQKYILAFTTCLFCALDIDEEVRKGHWFIEVGTLEFCLKI